MVANFARNVQEGRIRLGMGICEAIWHAFHRFTKSRLLAAV